MTTTDTRAPEVDPTLVRPTATPDTGGRPGVPMPRLVHVELRKMVDTRAGRWMLITMSAISVVVLAVFLIWGPADEATYATLLGLTSFPLVVLLPILGIMAATAEWSQRTGLVTFTLEPRRGRVVLAKVVAALLLGLVVTVTAFAAAAVANVIGSSVGDGSGAWDVTWKVALGVVLGFAIYVLQGLAFGFVFLNTPFAIVASLLLPTIWTIAVSLVSSLAEPSKWLDLNQVTEPLFSGSMTGENWGQLSTSFGAWVLVPLVLGAWRVLHREVK
ncbi:ABC transporter permease [Knoellia sp. CPCC 206450]|uniref:ABC transporter permease n=1 Tax=Knoellia tibetensis TaxID=3404798 RepID=UPI003B435C9E